LECRGAVLFDAAGTLIELREPVGETYARVAREHGVTLSPNQPAPSPNKLDPLPNNSDLLPNKLEVAFHAEFDAAPAMAFPDALIGEVSRLEKAWWRQVVSNTFQAADPGAKFPDFDRFFESLFDVMGQPQTWREVPGARNLLLRLRSLRWATAIVSNFDRRLPSILQALGLADLFDIVVLCSDVAAAKPEPAIFLRALERLQVQAAHAVVVGDDEALDIEGARAAGLRAIDVKSLAKLDDLLDQLAALPDQPGERRGGPNHGE
jgi:putative hydrolase of the HAD superfamily